MKEGPELHTPNPSRNRTLPRTAIGEVETAIGFRQHHICSNGTRFAEFTLTRTALITWSCVARVDRLSGLAQGSEKVQNSKRT